MLGAFANPPTFSSCCSPGRTAAAGAWRRPGCSGRGGAGARRASGRRPPGGPDAGGTGQARWRRQAAADSEKLAEGVWRINGAYNALAVEFSDHIVLFEPGPQNEARGAGDHRRDQEGHSEQADPLRRDLAPSPRPHAGAAGRRRRRDHDRHARGQQGVHHERHVGARGRWRRTSCRSRARSRSVEGFKATSASSRTRRGRSRFT